MSNYIVRMGMFQRKQDITLEEFRDYWHYNHGAIASNMNALLKYDQNQTVRPLHFDIAREEDPFWVDGYSKLWFGDMSAQKNNDPEIIMQLRRDEEHLFAWEILVIAEEQVTMRLDPDAAFVKLISFVKRNPRLSPEEFRDAWWGRLSELILKMPGLIGCNQNWVFERQFVDVENEYARIPADHDRLPIDGVLEMYFRTIPEMNAAFESPEGKEMCACSRELLDKAAIQLTNQYRIFNSFQIK